MSVQCCPMRTVRTRTNFITANERVALVRKALSYRGLFTRIARSLGLTRQHVAQVARGRRQSKRVLEAVLAEIERIERRVA